MKRNHWSLEDISWSLFDGRAVKAEIRERVKTTALVESRAELYGSYLQQVFRDYPHWHARIARWQEEEAQHGDVLRRWVALAEPGFELEAAFRDYTTDVPYHDASNGSVRGSVTGELVSRCTVEALASAYYRALHDASPEPVLREICSRLARDEARHYRMFYDLLREADPLGWPTKLTLVLARVLALGNDHITYAAHCATRRHRDAPYERTRVRAEFLSGVYESYQTPHLSFALSLILQVLGIPPRHRMHRWLTPMAVVWVRVRAALFGLQNRVGSLLQPRPPRCIR